MTVTRPRVFGETRPRVQITAATSASAIVLGSGTGATAIARGEKKVSSGVKRLSAPVVES